MKKLIKMFLFLAPSILLLKGCFVSYGDYTSSQISYLENTGVNCENRAPKIHVFFEGEMLDFKYRKIGIVEAEGDEYAGPNEVLNHLKYEAWKSCGNGLINVNSSFKDREQGYLFDFDSDLTETYSSRYYSAIAVKIDTDSAFLEKYGSGVDTTFVTTVRKERDESVKQTSNQIALSIITTVILSIVLIIGIASS